MGGIGFLTLILKLFTCRSLAYSYSPARLSAPSPSSNLNELLSAYSVASEPPPSLRAAVSFRFRVMSYNIQQMLPFLKLDQKRRLKKLTKALRDLDESNRPDVIVFQEVFTKGAPTALKKHLRKLYPYSTGRIEGCFKEKWTSMSGNCFGPFRINGGTQIFSRYPIREAHAYAFSDRAGYDWYSKKGAVLTRIMVPGQKTQVDLGLGFAMASSIFNFNRENLPGKFYPANAFKRAFFKSASDRSFPWISSSVPATVCIFLPNAVKVSAFSFRSRPEPGDWYLQFSPLKFKLIGSNDCKKWTTILRVESTTWTTADQERKWIVPEEKRKLFKWIGFKVLKVGFNNPETAIQDAKFWENDRAIWLMGTHMQADDEEEIRVLEELEFTDWIDKKTSRQDPVIIAGDFNVENRAKPDEYKTMRKLTRLSINYTFSSPGSFSAETNMIAKLNCYPTSCPLSYDDTLDYIGYRRDRVKPIYAPEMRVLPVKASKPWYWSRLDGEWEQPGERSQYTDGYYRDYADHYPVLNDFYF